MISMAVPSAPGVAGVRVWEVMYGDGDHEWGDHRRRALMLAILMKRVNVITNEGTRLCARRLRISSLF